MPACTFIGHRNCSEDMKEKLQTILEDLIIKEKVDLFYVGNQGRFDRLVYQVLCDLENKYDIKTRVVLPYLNQKNEDIYFDFCKTIFPETITKTPPRFAIHKRNDYMLQKSEYLICYLEFTFSNTYTFVEKAKKQNIKIINIGSFPIEAI